MDKFKFSYKKEDMDFYDDEYFCKESIDMECEDSDVDLFKVFESFRRFLISCGYVIDGTDRIDIVPEEFDRNEYDDMVEKLNEPLEPKLLNENDDIEDIDGLDPNFDDVCAALIANKKPIKDDKEIIEIPVNSDKY